MTDTVVVVVSPEAVVSVPQAVGIPGPPGPPGSGGDANATWTQSSASAVWAITHALGKFPSVTLVDSSGSEVEGEIQYDSPSQITVTFSAALAGIAYLN